MGNSTRFYLKPMTRRVNNLDKVDPAKALKGLEKAVMKRVQSQLLQSTFSKRAKIALAKSITVKREGNTIVVTANHPAFFPLVKGKKKHQMTWLVKSKRPIPIITEQGKLIFRSATPRSMKRLNAKGEPTWTHPGHKAQDILERARQGTIEFLIDRVGREIKKMIKTFKFWG